MGIGCQSLMWSADYPVWSKPEIRLSCVRPLESGEHWVDCRLSQRDKLHNRILLNAFTHDSETICYFLINLSIFLLFFPLKTLSALISNSAEITHKMKFSMFTNCCIKQHIGLMWLRFLLTWDIPWEFDMHPSQRDPCLFLALIWHKSQHTHTC